MVTFLVILVKEVMTSLVNLKISWSINGESNIRELISNYEDDDNDDNFKKTIGLMIKTTTLHVHHAF